MENNEVQEVQIKDQESKEKPKAKPDDSVKPQEKGTAIPAVRREIPDPNIKDEDSSADAEIWDLSLLLFSVSMRLCPGIACIDHRP